MLKRFVYIWVHTMPFVFTYFFLDFFSVETSVPGLKEERRKASDSKLGSSHMPLCMNSQDKPVF